MSYSKIYKASILKSFLLVIFCANAIKAKPKSFLSIEYYYSRVLIVLETVGNSSILTISNSWRVAKKGSSSFAMINYLYLNIY
jgi:hypothetical protein